ncbi:MAG: murein transglycosylase [Phycisphaerales bacterium]|nr:MAG: murein transglycosylase [Phycisphaerales bacterium]
MNRVRVVDGTVMLAAGLLACGVLLSVFTGCQQQKVVEDEVQVRPDYNRQLPPGESALRKITDPERMPPIEKAFEHRNVYLEDAIDESLRWFRAPSSQQFFPFEEFTHDRMVAGLHAFRSLLEEARDAESFRQQVEQMFKVYESVGYNGEGVVLFTGYYAPIFQASRERTSQFTAPLYTRPDDLVTDPVTGEPKGRRMNGDVIVPYPTRREIEERNMFAGNELVWLENELDAFIVQVNGSAKLRLPDGEIMYIGYAGKTDRPYTGLGQSVMDEGLLSPDQLSLPAIRRLYQQQPELVRDLMLRNEVYVFFTEYSGSNWPAGSLGVPVTTEASLATDKRIYPRGGLVMVDTRAVTFSEGHRSYVRFMLDQDTGGAIQAPGRADIFKGIGPGAEILAGGQYAEGRLYYFLLREPFVESYLAMEESKR